MVCCGIQWTVYWLGGLGSGLSSVLAEFTFPPWQRQLSTSFLLGKGIGCKVNLLTLNFGYGETGSGETTKESLLVGKSALDQVAGPEGGGGQEMAR
jgi:hypothetical protein